MNLINYLNNKTMIKEDIISYFKVLGGILMISHLIYGFLSLESESPLLITSIIYLFLILLIIPLYNYLQYGLFWYWVNKNYRNYLKRKYGNY